MSSTQPELRLWHDGPAVLIPEQPVMAAAAEL